jgi:hypothetical protein
VLMDVQMPVLGKSISHFTLIVTTC